MRYLSPRAAVMDRTAAPLLQGRGPSSIYTRPWGLQRLGLDPRRRQVFNTITRMDLGYLGDAAQTVQQVSAIGTPVVLAGVSASAASAAAASGTAATILGMAPALAIPIIGAAIAGITIAVVLLLKSGCGQTCIVTSNWANQAEDLLKKNIQAYFSIPAPRTQSQQSVALANFDSIWNYLVSQCNNPNLGTAGVNCIQDRAPGSCKWKQTSSSVLLKYPGEPQPGECWNWTNGYRDPIAMDQTVPDNAYTQASDAATGTSTSGTSTSGTVVGQLSAATGLDSKSLLLLGAGLLILVGMTSGGGGGGRSNG